MDSPPIPQPLLAAARTRQRWIRTLHRWHWISSALCLVGMLLFAITGITLNHAGQIDATPKVQSRSATLPEPLRVALQAQAGVEGTSEVPPALVAWLKRELAVDVQGAAVEWSPDELYWSMPRAGGDAWLALDLVTGEAEFEDTDRGWVAYFNDLHKGRHTGTAWRWFLDVFSIAALVFCITGLVLLQVHSRQRAMTWPMVGLGLLLPLVLLLLFVH